MSEKTLMFAEERGIPADSPLAGSLAVVSLRAWIILALALTSVGFHLYLVFSGLIPALVTRPVHLILALPWIFLIAAGE